MFNLVRSINSGSKKVIYMNSNSNSTSILGTSFHYVIFDELRELLSTAKSGHTVGVSSIYSPDATTTTIKPFSEVPGPSSLPLVGPLRHFLPGGNLYKLNRQEIYGKLYELYGPIVKLDKMFNYPTTVFLYDADASAKFLRAQEPNPHRPKIETMEVYRQKFNKQRSMGALVNTMGPNWRLLRTAANKVMMHPKEVAASYSKILYDIAQEAVKRFKSKRDEKDMISNIDEEIKMWALESTGAVTLGRRLNCFDSKLPQDSYERRLISVISSAFEVIENAEYRPNSFLFLEHGYHKKVMSTYAELEFLITYFMNKTIKEWESKNRNNQLETSTLEKLLENNKEAALGVASDSIIAGVDSVSQNIMFIFYLLAMNQDKQTKLRDEILSEQTKKPYLRACIKEASRMLPTVGVIGRLTTKTEIILGYEIPTGITVVSQHGIMCMMEKHYPRAKEFIPERWLVEKDHLLYHGNAHNFTLLPFGYGVRTCIGRRVAELTMEALIVNMVKKFNIKWEGPPPKINIKTISKMEGPFSFVFKNV